MRSLVSESQQCQSYRDGHNVHHLAARQKADSSYSPATVEWALGSRELLVCVDGAKYTLFTHDPHNVARAIASAGAENTYFSTEFFWLKVQVPGGGLKLFSLSRSDPGPCLELV